MKTSVLGTDRMKGCVRYALHLMKGWMKGVGAMCVAVDWPHDCCHVVLPCA